MLWKEDQTPSDRIVMETLDEIREEAKTKETLPRVRPKYKPSKLNTHRPNSTSAARVLTCMSVFVRAQIKQRRSCFSTRFGGHSPPTYQST
jgi:hypothetical protein